MVVPEQARSFPTSIGLAVAGPVRPLAGIGRGVGPDSVRIAPECREGLGLSAFRDEHSLPQRPTEMLNTSPDRPFRHGQSPAPPALGFAGIAAAEGFAGPFGFWISPSRSINPRPLSAS